METQNTIQIIKETHNSEENALIVENYPYGFRLRTIIRYWVESNKNGDRFCSQTLNPKTNLWNKPKKSTYSAIILLIKDERGYISRDGLYFTTSKEEILSFMDKIKGYALNSFQIEQLRVLKAYSKVYENVKFECRVRKYKNKLTGEITDHINLMNINDYEELEEDKQEDLKQIEIKKQINKAVAIEYLKNEDLK